MGWTLLSLAVMFVCSQKIDQGSSSIHGWLIGYIVAVVVMIHDMITLELGVLITAHDAYAALLFIDTSIYGPVDDTAERLVSM